MIALFFLLPLYSLSVQYERGGLWKLLIPIACLTLLIDVALNYTELALLTLDFPRKGEFTFSRRLARLRYSTNWRGVLARYTTACLDAIAPSGKHIKP